MLVATTYAASAPAQPKPAEVARAVALFDRAKEKLAAGAVDEACALFVESYRADAQIGTLLNTALCHERAGKVASAWAEFTTVASLAARAGQVKRAEVAREHSRRLEPKLSRVRLDVREKTDALVVSVDGEPLAANDMQSAAGVPMDPGEHVVTARAP